MEVLRATGMMGVLIFLVIVARMDARTARISNGLLLAGILFVLFFVGMMEQNSGLPETVVGCAATGEARRHMCILFGSACWGLWASAGFCCA